MSKFLILFQQDSEGLLGGWAPLIIVAVIAIVVAGFVMNRRSQKSRNGDKLPTGFVGVGQNNQGIKINENAGRGLIGTGVVIAIIGVALILISPSFIFHDQVPGPFLGTTIMYDRTRDLTGVVKYSGIFLLVIGGIISAIGFSKSTSTQPRPSQLESVVTMKTCSECAESVKDAAKICRFCGHKFS